MTKTGGSWILLSNSRQQASEEHWSNTVIKGGNGFVDILPMECFN